MPLDRVAPGPLSEIWGAFWRESPLDGCTIALPLEARTCLAERWRARLRMLSPGTRLLDVACGKGAVLDHAAAAGLTHLLGVDLASASDLAGSGFEILGGADVRMLPFESRSFDVVVSQFGVEYAGLEAATVEAARVCRGTLIFLVHAADGIIVDQATEQTLHADFLENDLHAYARLTWHFAAPTRQSAADINQLLTAIRARAGQAANVSLLEGVYRSAIALQDEADPGRGVDRLAAAVRAHAGRMRALIEAAPDKQRAEAVAHRLESMEFTAKVHPEGGDGSPLIGRWIVAQREEGE